MILEWQKNTEAKGRHLELMRTNKKVLIESRKSENFLTLYELEREKDIIREEREKWILVENGKKP